jgi:hypothetical protein
MVIPEFEQHDWHCHSQKSLQACIVTKDLGFMKGSQKEMLLKRVSLFFFANNHCHTEVHEHSHLFASNCTILPNRWPTTPHYEMADISVFLKQ